MCKRCKHCGESNLGVLITQVSTIAARKLNGEIVEFFKESEENSQTEKINYCFTCNKQITEEDLIETVKCSSCGKEVNSVDKDGLCEECAKVKHEAEEEAKRIASMTQEELVAMIMAQKFGKVSKPESKPEEINNTPSTTELELEEKLADTHITDSPTLDEVAENKDDTKEKKVKKKSEPAPINTEEVKQAEQNIKEKVENVMAPECLGVIDESAGTTPTDVVQTIPTPEDGEEEDILAALNNVKIGDNGIPDIF